MTTDQKIDALGKNVSEHLDEHDQKFIDLGDILVQMSRKLDTVIEQTKEIPVIKSDISSIKHHIANVDHDIIDLKQGAYDMGLRYTKLEDKVDHLIERVDKIGAREYA